MIYPKIMAQEILAAGIQTSGCNAVGVVWDKDGVTEIQSRAEVAEIIALHQATTYDVDEEGNLRQTEVVFELPIVAPAGTFGDVYVASPKTEDTAEAALQVAEAEAKKAGRKSLAKIVLNLAEKYLPDLEVKVKKAKL